MTLAGLGLFCQFMTESAQPHTRLADQAQCGHIVERNAKFCGQCGSRVVFASANTVPKTCQNEDCDSTNKDVVACCADDVFEIIIIHFKTHVSLSRCNRCRQSNNGQTFYLCQTCTKTLHKHPLLRGHSIMFFSGDRDDVLSVSRLGQLSIILIG